MVLSEFLSVLLFLKLLLLLLLWVLLFLREALKNIIFFLNTFLVWAFALNLRVILQQRAVAAAKRSARSPPSPAPRRRGKKKTKQTKQVDDRCGAFNLYMGVYI